MIIQGTSGPDPKERTSSICICNTMVADDQAMKGARISAAAMVRDLSAQTIYGFNIKSVNTQVGAHVRNKKPLWPQYVSPWLAGYVDQAAYIVRLILGLRPANERRRYKVTPSLIGWAQT